MKYNYSFVAHYNTYVDVYNVIISVDLLVQVQPWNHVIIILYFKILYICIDYLLSMFLWLLLSIGLRAPANVVAKAKSCDTVTLQWTQPSTPNDITTSVSCTPTSPGCAECTTSPCTITGLNPSTEYEFTVTLNSVMCGTSMNTTGIGIRGEMKCVKK